jgi:hypothetical protein
MYKYIGIVRETYVKVCGARERTSSSRSAICGSVKKSSGSYAGWLTCSFWISQTTALIHGVNRRLYSMVSAASTSLKAFFRLAAMVVTTVVAGAGGIVWV